MREYSEAMISAFLSHHKPMDIAAAAGVTVSTVNKYKHDQAFQAVLNERRAAIISAAVDRMTESILQDAKVLQSIIDDEKVNAGIRTNAINIKWVHLREWRAMLDFEARLRALEIASMGVPGRSEPGGDSG